MKKFISFTFCVLAILIIFIYALEMMALPNFARWLNHHSSYLTGLFVTYVIVMVLWIRHQRKKYQLQFPNERKQGNLQLDLNTKTFSESRLFFILIGVFLLYCGAVLFFFAWSIQNLNILVSGLSFGCLGIVAILIWAYQRNNKWKLERSLQAQETLSFKLRSIRSQLNPHFMFNALTSIQNLVNKNDNDAANHYLTLFADLTRKVLSSSDQDVISIEEELKILDDYLQMEQLRFGFQYLITVDDNMNIANTEIPAMLLQPFVENAVKHGVAALQEKGIIELLINKHGNDVVLSVTDNGEGFDKSSVQNSQNSFGLKLSEERIALLNQVNKRQPLTLAIDSLRTGTTITLKLANLLS
jgi:sensor histidine kinase YesM